MKLGQNSNIEAAFVGPLRFPVLCGTEFKVIINRSLKIPLSVFVPETQDELLTSAMVKDVIAVAGNIISYAILRVCWPTLSKAECFIFSKMNKDPTPFSAVLEEAFEEEPGKSETP